MADFIPEAHPQNYTRWQADDFGAPRVAKPTTAEAAMAASMAAAARALENPATNAPDHAGNAPSDAAEDANLVPAEQVKLPTVEELEQMHEEARQSGYQAGYDAGFLAGHDEGRELGRGSAEAYEKEIRTLCQGLKGALQDFDQDVAESVLACALEVASQLTRTMIRVQPESLLPTIREALSALPLQHDPVTLLVAPAEAEVIRAHLETRFSQDGWQIQEDPNIAPGGCRLRAGSSEVDATLNTRWRRILESIGVTEEWLAGAQPLERKDRRKNE
ncbi:flagellar assembly protein H [Betaproteobacteria bacterium]|nr:flagellar assembly protein H [Betaproteobacteria bacterium]